MADFLESNRITVRASSRTYDVHFSDDALQTLGAGPKARCHYLIDDRVAGLFAEKLKALLAGKPVRIVATESAKEFSSLENVFKDLLLQDTRRGDMLVAIGGGIIQDICGFIATTLFRGIEWSFYPTTLLAQADSCIGSKTSINLGSYKNILGTYWPPTAIHVDPAFLATLDEVDIRAGVGEMLKVHALVSPDAFDRVARDYDGIISDPVVRQHYVRSALEIKRGLIEQDEFDQGVRRLLNYGHSFGHALESASDFSIPHGIAVTIGMDIANYVAMKLGLTTTRHFERMRPVLTRNSSGFERTKVDIQKFLSALSGDKKNVGGVLQVILPTSAGQLELVRYPDKEAVQQLCTGYLSERFRPDA